MDLQDPPPTKVVTQITGEVIDDCTEGLIIPSWGLSSEDVDLDAKGQPLESVLLPISEDRTEWETLADTALHDAGWRRTSPWKEEADTAFAEVTALD